MLIRVAGERCALPVGRVREVGRLPVVTRVPGLPPLVRGVVTWRGRVLPVLDLAAALGTPVDASVADRLVVLTDGVGLAVAAVDDVVEVDDSMLAPVPSTAEQARARLVTGIVILDGGPVALLTEDLASQLRTGFAPV